MDHFGIMVLPVGYPGYGLFFSPYWSLTSHPAIVQVAVVFVNDEDSVQKKLITLGS